MILLDTHALIWWFDGNPRLSLHAKAIIENTLQYSTVAISSFTCWEITLLVAKQKIMLSKELHIWISMIEAIQRVKFIPVNNPIAIKSAELPGNFHKDPADRIIVATAMELNVPLVTVDQNIRAYPHVQTIW